MKLAAYIKRFSPEQRAAFALDVGTTVGHLNNVAYEMRVASAALTRQIVLFTGSEVREWELRPSDWHLIWTELVGSEGAPAVAAPAPTAEVAHVGA